MSSQLHEAVRLAQAGNKDEARQMLRQIIQTDPNNEMAWLWLASVAAERGEYQHALQEVLRINPANQQARDLMAQLQQQQIPYTPTQQPAPYVPPAAYGAPPGYYNQQPAPMPMMAPVVVQEPSRRRGCFSCSCTSCAILAVVLVILPILLCGVLSFAVNSLGPVDLIAGYLPGDLGRKTVEFETANRTVSVEVPRSWFPAIAGDTWWDAWQQTLDDSMPLAEEINGWGVYEVSREALLSGEEGVTIIEVNPATLVSSGGISGINFVRLVEPQSGELGSFRCEDVRSSIGSDSEIIEFDDGLCGTRTDSTMDTLQDRIFESYEAPAQIRVINLLIPETAALGSEWVVMVPEEQYDMFADDIEKMINSVSVE